MQIGADAIFDVVAPAPRAPNAPAQADDGPSFDDHLDANAESDPERAPGVSDASDSAPATEQDALPAPQPIAAPTPAHPPTQPVLVQIIASIETPTPPDSIAAPITDAAPATLETAPSAPQSAAPAPPTQAAQSAAPLTPAATIAPAAASAPLDAPAQSDAAPAPQLANAPVQPQSPVAQQHAVVAQAAITPRRPSADGAAAPATDADGGAQTPTPTATPAQAPPPISSAAQASANAARDALAALAPFSGAAASEAPKAEAAAAPVNAKQNTNAKSAHVGGAPQTGAKETPFAALLAASLSADTTAQPAPAPQTATQALAVESGAGAPSTHAALETSAQRAAPAAVQVGREIVRRFNGGNTSFELRLDPPELGRVEIKLDVSRDHRVTAIVAAESPQALTELSRHARELEQALNAAGLELTENGLSFDLTDQRQGAAEVDEFGARARASSGVDAAADTPHAPRAAQLERWRGVRVDLVA